MKNATQLKDLIRNIAKEKNINPQILLRNYMLERLLERIALSEFKDKFVLKGGMLVAAIVGVDLRSTIDMDATLKGHPLSLKTIEDILADILAVQINDGVFIELQTVKEIRSEAEYSGVRVALEARIENTRAPLKVDITVGDVITPREIVYRYNLLLEDRSIDVLAYNIETVLAEKLETLLARSIANTRMRDFYDLFILLKLQGQNVNKSTLTKAVIATAMRRGSSGLLPDGKTILKEVFADNDLLKQWSRYQNEYSFAKEISWEEIKDSVNTLWDMIF